MNAETKRHIDSARQVLVGVVPNPSTQIDQITNALIYKFMDDMDQSVIKIGGKPTFFVGDLEKYAWTRLMDARMGNQERMNLYGEALLKFSEAKHFPELFRDIFKQAILPYRSPEVLDLFLREINFFSYSHSEDLGDAFEYLLSVMSSQGDAGMFRTPRHIIEFIVDVVNPTKEDKILDPACGTAGFLISAYKHILEQHDGKDDPEKKEKPLTPEQKKALTKNFFGYDISPEMVRLSRVNMYLHHFKNPKIIAYNTLADEEYWNDKFDVILANPPFMSPKGAGKPHSKFTIDSSRSEVLFVDYIMNHLRPKGRAGVIVPEGIIFQSGTAHKQLRKNLIEDGLYAVVSLPSGVFAPYSGVKTSILLFNNELAKQSDEVAFVKIESDGFDLGAQRRASTKNDLPTALEVLQKWGRGEKVENKMVVYVKKEKIAENGDYNLSGDRYRISIDHTNTKWPSLKLKDLEKSGDITLGRGQVISKKDLETNPGIYPVYSSSAQGIGEFGQYGNFMFDEELITWSIDGGGRFFYRQKHKFSVTNVSGWLRINNPQKINAKYLFRVLDTEWQDKTFDYVAKAHPSVIREMYQIPLPPLEVQEQIVRELSGYEKIISGAQQIVQNWKPQIDIDSEWGRVKIGDVAKLMTGGTPLTSKREYYGGEIRWLVSGDINQGEIFDCKGRITELAVKESNAKILPINSVLMALNGQGKTRGTVAILRVEATCNQSLVSINPKKEKLISEFLLYVLMGKYQEIRNINGDNQRGGLNMPIIRGIEIPLPPLPIQKQIVSKIESERALVEGNKKLIEIYEQKTKDVIAKLWEG